MNFFCFLNTKLLFKFMRYDPQLGNAEVHRPVTVHMNYHPEKELRMADVNQLYHHGKRDALSRWNGGEGHNTGGCRGKVRRRQTAAAECGCQHHPPPTTYHSPPTTLHAPPTTYHPPPTAHITTMEQP